MAYDGEEAGDVVSQVQHLPDAAREVHEGLVHVAALHHLVGTMQPVGRRGGSISRTSRPRTTICPGSRDPRNLSPGN